MQIVIEIANDIVDCLNNGIGITNCQYKSLVDAITNGTPLPKRHGRLIDADALCDYFWNNRSKLYTHKDLQIAIDNAPTIIEAESEA